MTVDPRLEKFKESFKSLNELLDTFKNSKGSDLPKDLKFYRTVYGKVVTPALNNVMLTVHAMQEQLNSSFLPKKYPSGNLKVFNNHQLEMVDTFLDPNYQMPEEQAPVSAALNVTKPSTRNKFLELQQNSSSSKNVIKPKTNRTFLREMHPHADLIKNLNLPVNEMYTEEFDEAKFLERTLKSVPLNWVDSEDGLKEMFSKLAGEPIIAVDLEHHSFHSYTGLVSLIQISNSTEDFLVDPIKLREALQSPEMSLNRIFADAKVLKVFHGAESDIAWLQRDFDTFVVNMFDSYHAAKILNLPRMSLAYLLEQFCGVELDKKYQLADWRERPMPEEMIEYARKDTHYLVHLYFLLKRKLSRQQYEQVLKNSNAQCLQLYSIEPITEKTWKSVLNRSNYPLNPEQAATVRRLFYWREWKAKELDVSPAALMPNSYLVKIVHSRVKSVPELENCLRNVSELMKREFSALIEFLQSEESKETEFYTVESADVESSTEQAQPLHVRFDEQEAQEAVKIESPAVVKRVSKVSFVTTAQPAKAADIFQSKTPNSMNGKVLLAGLVREILPKIEPEEFKTREKAAAEREATEKAAKTAEEAKKVEESVKAIVHGSNRVIEDLEIVTSGSYSTVLADKLRKNTVNNSAAVSAGPDVIHFDYAAKDGCEQPANEAAEVKVFDPYNTIKSEKKRAFIEATIAPETGPRLSATRMSGNRMASFTKKRK